MEQAKGKKELQKMLDDGLQILIQRIPLANENNATFLRKQDLVANYFIGVGYKLVSVPSLGNSNICYVITVKTLTGKNLNICVRNTDTIEQLKE